nr:retrovirus-related Pol polyprotein from transposon TNT 1-94 [Tanacetum cinerariifolium]
MVLSFVEKVLMPYAEKGKVEFEFDVKNSTYTQPPFNDEHIETQDDGNMPTSLQSQHQTEYLLARDHERQQANRPPRLEDYQCDLVACAFAAAAHIKNCKPTNYLEAISSPKCDKWVVEMENEEEIYVEQPESFKVPEKEDHVCRLKKSLYGLKQSHRQWYKRCIFPLLIYVDDMLIVAPNKDQIRELKDQLSNEFNMKYLGAAKRILGMEIRRDQKMGKLTLSKTDYISKVLKKFNMSSCKPVPTPLAPYFKLSSPEFPKSEEDKEDMSRVLYSSAVGSLMYAMVCTHPNLDHAVSVVSRYMHNPAITTLSTTEAEYISSTEGVKEAIWLRGMVNEFGLPQEVLVVYCDNQSTVHLTKNNKFHSKTKHIKVRHHFVRDIVEIGEVIIDKIHTNDNPADMLTKVLTPTKFKHCLDLVGVIGV